MDEETLGIPEEETQEEIATGAVVAPRVQLFYAEAEDLLLGIPDNSIQLIFTDPPWDTGTLRKAVDGDPMYSYLDKYVDDDFEMMMRALFIQAQRVLKPSGTLAIWLGLKRTHDVGHWGKEYLHHVGDVIVQMELGNPGRTHWPQKHSTVLLFAKHKDKQYFDYRGLPEEDRRGSHDMSMQEQRRSSSVLRGTLANNSGERTGYPDQKSVDIVKAFIRCLTKVGDFVVDPFGGSGTTAAAVQGLQDRYCITGDRNEGAIRVMRLRLDVDPSELLP